MSLQPGVRLGPYEILSALWAGGMGEVYRARDTKLNREVALKVLPDAFTRDPDRLARFKREAQVLASLNHPHIGAIYGFEDRGETHALVLELVEGDTLADRIARGPMPLDEALPIARQIGEALESAHEQGIIHRDLKPANVKITLDGVVKVLDFGLAKLAHPDAAVGRADVTESPTITSPGMMTGVGVLLGTAAYMSPEQAKGREADKRSDIWAFGCVLYEMLTGKRPFDGEDMTEVLGAVVRLEPTWEALPSDVPEAVRILLQRCLVKDRRKRIADIGTARFVLDHQAGVATTSTASAASLPIKPLWRRAIPVLLSAILAGVLATAAADYLRPSQAPLVVTRFPFTLVEGQAFTAPALGRQVVAISPDGSQMVYVANGRLHLRSMSELEARPIATADTGSFVSNPVFSPDSRSVAFWSSADQTLKKVAVMGGAAVTICPADQPFGMSWGTTGIVFGQGNTGIMRVSASGGTPEVLVPVKTANKRMALRSCPVKKPCCSLLPPAPERWDKAQIVTQSLRSGERKTLINGGSDGRYVPTGHLVCGANRSRPMHTR